MQSYGRKSCCLCYIFQRKRMRNVKKFEKFCFQKWNNSVILSTILFLYFFSFIYKTVTVMCFKYINFIQLNVLFQIQFYSFSYSSWMRRNTKYPLSFFFSFIQQVNARIRVYKLFVNSFRPPMQMIQNY